MGEGAAIKVPTGVGDLTAEWLSDAIGFGRITAVEASEVGTGQIADSYRFRLTWDGDGDGERPDTVVVKVISAAEASRAAAKATRTYEVEVGFYTDLAPSLSVHIPKCYWAGHDPANEGYAVVLEDMAPAVQGDQLAGCSVDEAAAALREAALLHGPRWGDPSATSFRWLAGGISGSPAIAGFLETLVPRFLERYSSMLVPEAVDMVNRFAKVLGASTPVSGPRTIVHNDFRVDNLLFGGERVCVLDWQTVSAGAGLVDVSYFLGGSLLTDDRRRAEGDLVRSYHEQLVAQGVDLSWDDCWTAYRRHALAGLTMAVVASMLVVQTDRGDAMFCAMAERAALHAIDVDTEALLLAG